MKRNESANVSTGALIVSRKQLGLAASQCEAELIEITRHLVRQDSQNPPGRTESTAQVAASILAECERVEMRFHRPSDDITNLVCVLHGTSPGPRLVLSGHLDTYPIGTRESWNHDPLGGEKVNHRLYGRGAGDMKGGLAACLMVMRLFHAHMKDFPGVLVLALAGDEENMGELGTQSLIDTVPACRGDAVIVADVSAPEIPRCGEKGMLWLTLTASGCSAHGAHVHLGQNSIEILGSALRELKKLERWNIPNDHEAVAVMARAQALSEPIGGIGERSVMENVTVNIGKISGGESANLVPATATSEIDIRIPLGVSTQEIEAAIEQDFNRINGITWEITRRYEPTWTRPDENIVQDCVAAAHEVLDTPVAINMRVGGSDARLWRRAGIPTVVCGPTPYNLGAPDEYLDTRELAPLTGILTIAAFDFLHHSKCDTSAGE